MDIWLARMMRKDGLNVKKRKRKKKGREERRSIIGYVDQLEGEFAIRLFALCRTGPEKKQARDKRNDTLSHAERLGIHENLDIYIYLDIYIHSYIPILAHLASKDVKLPWPRIRVISKVTSHLKNIDKQTAERFKQLERKRKRRKKKRKEKKIETIGKRNIELGRDT